MKYIALRSLHHGSNADVDSVPVGENRYDSGTDHRGAVDEDERTGMRYMNPSLIVPLEEVWLSKRRANVHSHRSDGNGGDV